MTGFVRTHRPGNKKWRILLLALPAQRLIVGEELPTSLADIEPGNRLLHLNFTGIAPGTAAPKKPGAVAKTAGVPGK
jgi:hypothetical protein